MNHYSLQYMANTVCRGFGTDLKLSLNSIIRVLVNGALTDLLIAVPLAMCFLHCVRGG